MRYHLKGTAVAAALGSFTLFAACNDSTSVPDLNNVSSATITNGLNAATVQLLTTGLLNSNRINYGFRYIVFSETMARDVYNLDPAESRFITELLGVPIDPSAFTGGGQWLGFYQTIRTANTLIDNLKTAADVTPAGQAGVRGIAQTIKGLELYNIWSLRGNNGLPVNVGGALGTPLAPILCTPNALAAISATLDSGATDLAAAGSTFSVSLPLGFSLNGAFNTPAGFLAFNKALKARVEVYRGIAGRTQSFTDAIALINSVLSASTFNPANLASGVYYVYSTAPGETQRPIAANTIYLNPAVGDSVNAADKRKSKIVTVARVSRNNVSTTFASPLSAPGDLTTPLPLIRTAELIALRAQANIGLGNLSAAVTDLNTLRTTEGGLPAYTSFASAKEAIDATLYEKRYSFLLEGAQRLVDLRSYGRLNAQNFKPEQPVDAYNNQLPIPKTEADLRSGQVTCQ